MMKFDLLLHHCVLRDDSHCAKAIARAKNSSIFAVYMTIKLMEKRDLTFLFSQWKKNLTEDYSHGTKAQAKQLSSVGTSHTLTSMVLHTVPYLHVCDVFVLCRPLACLPRLCNTLLLDFCLSRQYSVCSGPLSAVTSAFR